jgi:hypothetical protein
MRYALNAWRELCCRPAGAGGHIRIGQHHVATPLASHMLALSPRGCARQWQRRPRSPAPVAVLSLPCYMLTTWPPLALALSLVTALSHQRGAAAPAESLQPLSIYVPPAHTTHAARPLSPPHRHRAFPPDKGSSALPSACSRSISIFTAARPAAVSQSSRIVVSCSSWSVSLT